MAEQAHQARPDAPVEIVWQPQKGPQHAFVTCPIFEVFYGGARGGGKTDGFLGEFARHAGRYGRDAIGLAIRRERTQLIETIERSRAMYTQIGAVFHEQEKMWRFPNGARLRFAYLERDSDAEAYQGHSYTRVYVEEITNFPDPKPLLKLMATLRSGAGVPCGFRATGNPGGPGHHWVKQRYIDPAPNGMQPIKETFKNPWSGEVVERERIYIPARVTDNKFLGTDYVANLQMAGSAQLVRAWLSGDWSVIEGAFFDCWSHQRHVVRPFVFPSDWSRIRAADWGSAKPFCILWLAVVTDDYTVEHLTLPRGALVVYREWYGSPNDNNAGLKLTAETVAEGIRVRETTEEITNAVLDPAAFSSDGGPSIAERMATRDVIFRRADNKRVTQKGAMGGWDQVRSRLIGEAEDRPMLVVFETCRNLIRTLPALQHDEDKPEDVDCLVAGTLVATPSGDRPIEDIRPGDLVHTPVGPQTVLKSYVSGDSETVWVRMSDGRVLKGTPHHKLYVTGRGLVALSDIKCDDVLIERTSAWRTSLLSTAVSFTNGMTAASTTTRTAQFCRMVAQAFTGRFGWMQDGPFRLAGISTTPTAITTTTGLRTSSASRREIISGTITPSASTATLAIGCESGERLTLGRQSCELTASRCAPVRRSVHLRASIVALLVKRDILLRPFVRDRAPSNSISRLRRLAEFVGLRFAPSGTPRRKCRPARIVAVGRSAAKEPVFNLTVERAHLFYANGVLSSNTDSEDHAPDALRYGCMSRPWAAARPQRPKPLLDWRSQTLDQLWTEHDRERNRHY